jgi:hypothetical protein
MPDANDGPDRASRWLQAPRPDWLVAGCCLTAALGVYSTADDLVGTVLAAFNLVVGAVCLTAAAVDGPHTLSAERDRGRPCRSERPGGLLRRIRASLDHSSTESARSSNTT